MATITVVAVSRGGQQQPLPHPDTLSPQQLREWVIQRGHYGPGAWDYMRVGSIGQQRRVSSSVGAAALGASEPASALGASASAATGASESAASAEALHTFTLDSGASRCFFRDCTPVTPLAAPVPVSLADLSHLHECEGDSEEGMGGCTNCTDCI
ncbi:unnamed protein product [Closterium sp. NIES-54]